LQVPDIIPVSYVVEVVEWAANRDYELQLGKLQHHGPKAGRPGLSKATVAPSRALLTNTSPIPSGVIYSTGTVPASKKAFGNRTRGARRGAVELELLKMVIKGGAL